MKGKDAVVKEKEKAEKMKALRRELEAELEEQLADQQQSESDVHVEVHKIDTNQALEPDQARQVIEALLFASSKPLTVPEIRKVIRGMTPKQVEEHINALRAVYAEQNRSFEILEIAGGYEIATKREFAPWIMKVELQKKVRQATQSALETLAILAYKQPITRSEIEELRGVDVSGVITTLTERGFIKIVGKKEVPGRPFLYGTTEKFLEHFGLNSLQDLPSIDEIKTIVESSVKKDELLGKTQMVAVPEGEAKESSIAESEAEMNSDTPAEQAETEVEPITAEAEQDSEEETDLGSEKLT